MLFMRQPERTAEIVDVTKDFEWGEIRHAFKRIFERGAKIDNIHLDTALLQIFKVVFHDLDARYVGKIDRRGVDDE